MKSAQRAWIGSTLLVAYQAMRVAEPQAKVTLVRMPLGEWVVAGFLFSIGASFFSLIAYLVAAFVLAQLPG